MGKRSKIVVWMFLGALGWTTPPFAKAQDADAVEVRPVPREPNGRPSFEAPPGEPGLWIGNGGRLAVNPNSYEPRSNVNAPIHIDDVPLQEWARALTDYRHEHVLSHEPHPRCKPSGGPREFITPYGLEFVQVPELERIYVFDVAGAHTFRVIYMDGRDHPEDLTPTYYGHSVGHWEGDTLVIDSVAFNESFWMNRDGLPHTRQLHLVERISRPDFETLHYEVTIDDPGAYTAPWTSSFSIGWVPGPEVWEYICQDRNLFLEVTVNPNAETRLTPDIAP